MKKRSQQPPPHFSNHWKLFSRFFQSLETFYVIFPIIGNFLCDFSNHWKKAIALFLGLAAFAGAQEFTLQTDYENFVFDPSPEGGAYSNYFGVWPKPGQTNGSTLLYDGHVLGNTNGTAPAGGGFMLPYSSFGQTIEGIQADFALGDEITPPPGANISVPPANFVARTAGNNTNAYYECTDPLGGAFWAPSTYKVFAAQPNNVEIHWRMLDGSTNVQVVTIDAVPCKRPARLFWTESPYDAPKVNLDGLFPKLHYNSEVSVPVYVVTTNQYGGMTDVVSNVVSGVWIDDQKQLHAVGVSGMFLLEYYKEGSYSAQVEPHAIEVVQVLEPEIATLEADIGERLLPVDSYWSQVDGDAGVYPQVQRGINDTVYVNALDGPKDNWAYAIKKTVDEPWAIEIYWEHEGLMNVMWPYEVDWYSCDWPTHPQRYVMAENTQYQARVLIPGGLTAQVMPFMEPNLHANLTTSGRAFYTTEPGWSLLKFTTADDIWFEVVQAVYHDDGDYFDLEDRAWEIGAELIPPLESNHALAFDGSNDFVSVSELYIDQQSDWSLSLWFLAHDINQGTLFSQGSPNLTFLLSFTNNGAIMVGSYSHDPVHPYWLFAETAAEAVEANRWHFLSVVCTDSTTTGGLVSIYIDGESVLETNMLHLIGSGAAHSGKQTVIGARAVGPTSANNIDFMNGRVDQVRLWQSAQSHEDLWADRYATTSTLNAGLVADFPFDEGTGDVVHDNLGGKCGTVYGNARWTMGQIMPHLLMLHYPGYLYLPAGVDYNVNTYDYPTEENPDTSSYIFAVNEGVLEVWWANRSRQFDMPAVYYPSYVARYQCDWPTNAPEIVIASGLGSEGAQPTGVTSSVFYDGSLYVQNDASAHGYNPNEEHALLMGGVAYALRDDLNTATSSEPYVLIDYNNATTGRRAMRLFHVLRTNAIYAFSYGLEAGLPIEPPMPLGAMPLCQKTYSYTQPPAWRDRKAEWWARSAGNNGGSAEAQMHFYYQMQPTFWFPGIAAAQQPVGGTELPWLPIPPNNNGLTGTPVTVRYNISWPEDIPELYIAQTLTEAWHGLPDLWNQLSVEILYQQSEKNGYGDCTMLFDPVVAHGAPIDYSAIESLLAVERAKHDTTDDKIRFPALPPSLYPRIYYDPDLGGGELVLMGELVDTLTGSGYLLLNCLSETERVQARAIADDTDASVAWIAAVNALSNAVTPILPNIPYVNAALYAGLGAGSGYVTLAFNNSTNEHQVPPALPVSLSIIRVVPELYTGELEIIEPDDVLDEQLNLRASPDFAGRVDDFTFQWRWAEPVGGLPPNTNYLTWSIYGMDTAIATNEITISGASPFTLRDNYFAVRYKMTHANGATSTNWSDWTYNLAPGWIQRVMNGINPFEQCFEDKVNNAVDTRATMIQMAGPPYEGDIALNQEAADEGGLIPLYQTVLNRAADFSINAGLSDPGNNESLLYAAGRLHDLYMLLANEAYADALDPSIAFPRSLYEDEHGAEAASIFCFMNQVPNLLDEELVLLRGRDDTLEPSVRTSPIYNRFLWNFTAGINGGEPAYAYNYNIRGAPTTTVGVISVDDAKNLYPQGHGDAWGYYLSANAPYMLLLANTNFGWQTQPGATLVGNAPVSTDFMDEQKFAETAAGKARAGVDIINREYRRQYRESDTAWAQLSDTDTNRAWGVGDWGARVGQGAYYDWALANSLLLDNLTNLVQVGGSNTPPEGIQKIDRATTPELAEIAAALAQAQQQLDNAGSRLNPLGLGRHVIPFDISPAAIDEGQTHFEQIYDRALQALYNACIAFDHARGITLRLREQFDSTYDLSEQLAENEIEFHNRLIAIFGTPYGDDIGPTGAYPQGYEGPDLINWQIIDIEKLDANAPTGQPIQLVIQNYNFLPGSDFEGHEYEDYEDLAEDSHQTHTIAGTTTIYMAQNGLKVKPPGWSGQRASEGELQLALRDYISAWYELNAMYEDYCATLAKIEVDIAHRLDDYERYYDEWSSKDGNFDRIRTTTRAVEGLEISIDLSKVLANDLRDIALWAADGIPEAIEGVLGPIPVADFKENIGDLEKVLVGIATYGEHLAIAAMKASKTGTSAQQELWNADLEELLTDYEYYDLLRWNTADTLVELRQQYVKQAQLMSKIETLDQMYARIGKLLAEGQLLLAQRGQVRARAAQRIQMNRYADLSFRIFRDDALRRYSDAFDFAARYVYLAAKAYDYETGLLDTETDLTPGQTFLEDIVRARLPGRFYTWLGTPQIGAETGEPGLADIMARMKADWDVVKGRFGFNNPENETSRFSLRSGLFRISPYDIGDITWAQVLENYRIDDLNQLPEYRRYCIPLSDDGVPEPALVIPFSSMINLGKNFFGHPLAAGDAAYDPTRSATKIRSVGVWFTGYNATFNTNEAAGGGLASQPIAYLLPVGRDVMRSPTRGARALRSYQVLDQALPLPYNIGASELNDPDWSPVRDSLAEPLAAIRRFAAFRAYHDSGSFDEAETHNAGRLVGRSVWNSQWLLIIPGRALLSDPDEALERFIYGTLNDGVRDGNGITDIKLFFQTYGIWGE